MRSIWLSYLILALQSTSIARPTADYIKQTPLTLQPADRGTVRAWRFNTTSDIERRSLLDIAQKLDADVWGVTGDHIDMRLPSNHLPSILSSFQSSQLTITIPPPNSFASAKQPSQPSHHPYPLPPTTAWDLSKLASPFHESYHNFEDIIGFANELSRTFPHYVELVRVGQSSEGREIIAIKIEEPGGKRVRPRIVIQGAQHARDWIAISAALYFAHSLVVPNYQPGSFNTLLEHSAFTIIPVPNPDGYVYTWDYDRLWYKNRMVLPESNPEGCVGLDMNRNWGHHWAPSDDPCHHWYGGAKPFEAPEVNAIASYIEREKGIKIFVDLRSYGQMLIYPYSYTCDEMPAHAEDLIEAALGAAKANKLVHGTSMRTGSACELLYSAPGSVLDWAYADAGISFSYGVFLRDTGTYGFLLPPTYIRPVGEENSMLIDYLAKWYIKNKY